MAVISKIIKDNTASIQIRSGAVLADITFDNNFFQIRTYADVDFEREKGAKQNIQLTKKQIELDVDFIGNQEPLTEKEKQAISDFIRKNKRKRISKRRKKETEDK